MSPASCSPAPGRDSESAFEARRVTDREELLGVGAPTAPRPSLRAGAGPPPERRPRCGHGPRPVSRDPGLGGVDDASALSHVAPRACYAGDVQGPTSAPICRRPRGGTSPCVGGQPTSPGHPIRRTGGPERVSSGPTTGPYPGSNMDDMPNPPCPRCGVRQYAAASYVEQPRCVVCDSALRLPRSASPRLLRWPPSVRPPQVGVRNGSPP